MLKHTSEPVLAHDKATSFSMKDGDSTVNINVTHAALNAIGRGSIDPVDFCEGYRRYFGSIANSKFTSGTKDITIGETDLQQRSGQKSRI